MRAMKSLLCWNSDGVKLPEESSKNAMSMMLSQGSISGRRKLINQRVSWTDGNGGWGESSSLASCNYTEAI